jgi:hypothetical protein
MVLRNGNCENDCLYVFPPAVRFYQVSFEEETVVEKQKTAIEPLASNGWPTVLFKGEDYEKKYGP